MKIIREHHTEIVGRGAVLLSSPPEVGQCGELYAGRIVEEVALLSKAHAIIGMESEYKDLDKAEPIAAEFDESARRIVDDFGIKCLLVILGQDVPGIEIHTFRTAAELDKIVGLVKERLAADFVVSISSEKTDGGDRSSKRVQTISLALGPEERGFRKDATISGIADVVGLVNAKLGYSERDERTGDALD